MKKQNRAQSCSRKTIIIAISLFVLLTMGVGYSTLGANLGLNGIIGVYKFDSTLYDVLKKEAEQGIYAREYAGEHNDSFDESLSTEKIYYWYGSDDTNATAILDKWNVIFDNYCWQMLRTTDTGGVKLIYNGVANNGKCNNTGNDQTIGSSIFNADNTSPADAGYMLNKRYVGLNKARTFYYLFTRTAMTSDDTYVFGTGVSYNSSTGKYTLSGTSSGTWSNQYSSVSGLYTCNSTDSSCTSVYYIAGTDSEAMYGFQMTDGHMLSYYDTSVILGKSYTQYNGTYTLTDTVSVRLLDWVNDYSNYHRHYMCKGGTATTCTEIRAVNNTMDVGFTGVSNLNHNYIYANSFTYDSSTGTYTLDPVNRVQTWDFLSKDGYSPLDNNHYTCYSTSDTCTDLFYVYVFNLNIDQWAIQIQDGKTVDVMLYEMLHEDAVNTNDSVIKQYIDNWYATNLSDVSSKIEDAIYCDNRSIVALNGWDPNGVLFSDTSSQLLLKERFISSDLNCSVSTDQFSLNNPKAPLAYPVGLITSPEMNLLNNDKLRAIGVNYWLLSPNGFYTADNLIRYIDANGEIHSHNADEAIQVRPAISLKPGIHFSSGDGSRNNPYVIRTN